MELQVRAILMAGFQKLLAAHEHHPDGRLAYANFLLAHGRIAEAMIELQILRQQHPLLYAVPAVAWNYLMQGETDLAWREIQRITSTEPRSAAYHASAQHIAWRYRTDGARDDHFDVIDPETDGFNHSRLGSESLHQALYAYMEYIQHLGVFGSNHRDAERDGLEILIDCGMT